MTLKEKIKDLQERLHRIRVRDLLHEKIAAELIGINRRCLQMFMDGETTPHFVTLAKIEKFVLEREKSE